MEIKSHMIVIVMFLKSLSAVPIVLHGHSSINKNTTIAVDGILSDPFVAVQDDSKGFCGLKESVIEAYLVPPKEVQEFISVAFGITFDVGPLSKSASSSCKTLGNVIGDVEMAWFNIAPGKVTNFIANTTLSRDANFKKCKRRGQTDALCRSEEKMATPKASYAQTYLNLPFPICMAVRPCDNNNGKIFQEWTFGIHFGDTGLPIFAISGIKFGLVELAFSSTGSLTTAQFDKDLPALLDVVPHKSRGMHVYLEASVDFPMCKIKGKDILKITANVGFGVYARVKLWNGKKIVSPAQFFGYFMESGGDFNAIATKFRNGDSAMKSVDFEINGRIIGVISINLANLLGMKNLNDMSVDVKCRNSIQVHLEQGRSTFAWWYSFEVKYDLKSLLGAVPVLGELVPSIQIQTLTRFYASIKESGGIDFVGAFRATFKLNCGPIETLLDIWRNLVNTIKDQFKGTPLDPLITMIKIVTDFLAGICSGSLKIGIQIRVNNGVVPFDTFLEFQSNKLRLSDLPICGDGAHGVQPSPYAVDTVHDDAKSRCSTNDDCWSNDGAYKVGIYNGNRGYCMNHPALYTVVGCLGRCIKKMAPGQSCSEDRMHIFHLARLDFTNAEHAACQSGQCTCGVCTDGNKKVPNGGKCAAKGDCVSGWCEGDVVVDCRGTCRPKRKTGTRAYHGLGKAWGESCESGREQCGTCTANFRDSENGMWCSGYAQCLSGWCEGDVVEGCRGKCQAKRAVGQAPWKGWQRSCLSGKEQCGRCTANYEDTPNGGKCSGWKQCASNWCEGDIVHGCAGTCQRKRNDNENAWKGWSASCRSGREQCGVCTNGGNLASGKRCSKSSNCASDYCGCSGWFCTVWNCGGRCR